MSLLLTRLILFLLTEDDVAKILEGLCNQVCNVYVATNTYCINTE